MFKRDISWAMPELVDPVVVCPPEQRAHGSLVDITFPCVVVDSLIDVTGEPAEVVLSASLPGGMEALTVAALDASLPSGATRLFQMSGIDGLEQMAATWALPCMERCTLVGVAWTNNSVITEIHPAADSDRPLGDFARALTMGLKAGRAAAHTAAHESAESPEPLADRLAAALELIGDMDRGETPVDDAMTEEQFAPSEKAALEGRITTLSVKLAALERKYNSLANSRLGRLQLQHWERRKGN